MYVCFFFFVYVEHYIIVCVLRTITDIVISTLRVGSAQIQCYSTDDCSGTHESTSIEECCRDTLMGISYTALGAGGTCTGCIGMYNKINEYSIDSISVKYACA